MHVKKKTKERITIFLCCMSLGEKFVIVNAAKPDIFKKNNVKINYTMLLIT